MKIIVPWLALALSLTAMAAEIKLATITSDTVTDVTVFYLETENNGEVQAFRYVTTAESGQITEDVHGGLAQVQAEGFVVEEMEGREIIRLFVEKFSPATGGDVRLYSLVNGVTGSYTNFYLKLGKHNGAWVLKDTKGDVINKIFIAGNWSRILRRWIGISDLRTSYALK